LILSGRKDPAEQGGGMLVAMPAHVQGNRLMKGLVKCFPEIEVTELLKEDITDG